MYELAHSHSAINGSRERTVVPLENDDTLGRLIAVFLHNRLFGGAKRSTPLKEMGWNDSLVTEMSEMPINDVAKILGGSGACLGIVFDHRKAAAVVNSYRALKRDEQDLNYFIENGASPTLLKELFPKLSARLVAQQRKRLGCDSRGGRPPLPDAEIVHAIYRAWHALSVQETNLRQRYKLLKERFPALSFGTLCAALETN